jgi:hypothetical protein
MLHVGLSGAAILFLCVFDYFALARSGMETSFFVFLVVATLHEINAHASRSPACCGGLSYLARPEGLVLVVSVWRRRDSVTRPDALGGIALLLLVIGCWAVFAVWTFGSVVPQSILAKAATTRGAGLRPLISCSYLARFFLKGQHGGEVFVSTWLQLSVVVTLLAAVAVTAIVRALVGERESRSEDRALVLLVFPALVVEVSCAILIVDQLAAGWLVKLPNDRTFWVDGYVRVATIILHDERIRVAACQIGALGGRSGLHR